MNPEIAASQSISTSEAGVYGWREPGNLVILAAADLRERLTRTRARLPTGFATLDERIGPFSPGTVFLLASRPSMGKTAFALQIVEQIAVKMKKPVAYVSLRQPASVLLQRFICSLGRIDFCKIHAGFFGRLDFEAIKAATTRLSVCPFFVDDTPDLDIHSLCARVRHLNASRPLGLVIIDDLEFLELATRLKNGTSVDVPFAIKCLARETGVPFLLLSGLEEPTRSNPRIRLIEEIPASVQKFSDTVGFLWKTASEDSQVEDAELIISRNDDGGVGAIALCFQKGELRFEEHVDQRLGTIQSVES